VLVQLANPVNPSLDPSNILTLDEVAARLKVSRRIVYEQTRRRCPNPIPVLRCGRALRFNWLDVSAWLLESSKGAS